MITVQFPHGEWHRSISPRPGRCWSLDSVPKEPGVHFRGVTPGGRYVPCTVGEDGKYSADTHEVTRLIGWLPNN